MKKILSSLLVSIAAALPLAAFPEQAVENTVLRAEAAQRNMPVLSAQEMQAFKQNLAKAIVVMQQDNTFELDPAQLAEALLSSVSRVMEDEKEVCTHAQLPLSAQEQRAVYYAIYTLLPAQNRRNILSVKEYTKQYPVTDWETFRQTSRHALDLVVQAVSDIANQTSNYKYTWLFLLTH